METLQNIEVLDVTIIEPRFKHPKIFEMFDKLTGGEGFIIHNDHDPKPLYYQLLGERGNIFRWEYLLKGPEIWEVHITKLTPSEGETVGELVAKDYRKAQVFKKYGIDFCCGGKKSVKQVCEEKGISEEALAQELSKTEETRSREADYEKWELSFLTDYIVNQHHTYVREAIPVLYEFITKVARVHGQRHPELVDVAKHFTNICNELESHMPKEERVLFPYIKQLDEARKNGTNIEPPVFGTIQNPINMMEMEHAHAGSELEAIRKLTNDFTLPADACTTYTVTFKKLQEFEEDLFLHIHLENNVLFPRAIALEKETVN